MNELPSPADEWSPVTNPKLICASVIFAVIAHSAMSTGWVTILDDTNLIFHEAGHPIFGILGDTMQWFGGTLGQLAFPVVVSISLWSKKESLGFAIGLLWFFENFLNIARYMGDARAQLLPLLGGGEHDWGTIFGWWGLLAYDTKIAAVVRAIGWLGMLGTIAWLGWRWKFESPKQEA